MNRISDLRKEIDAVDEKIVCLIEKRIDIAKAIGAEKKEKRIPVEDRSRETELLKRLKAKSEKASPELIEFVFKKLISESKKAQK